MKNLRSRESRARYGKKEGKNECKYTIRRIRLGKTKTKRGEKRKMPIISGDRYKKYEPLERSEEWKQRRIKLMKKYGKPALMGVQTARKKQLRKEAKKQK